MRAHVPTICMSLQDLTSSIQLTLVNDVTLLGNSRSTVSKLISAYTQMLGLPQPDRSVAKVSLPCLSWFNDVDITNSKFHLRVTANCEDMPSKTEDNTFRGF